MATQRPDFFTVLSNGNGAGHAGTHRPLKVLFAVLRRHALKPTATIQKAHKEPGALHFSGGFQAVEHPFSVLARGPVALRLAQAIRDNRARLCVAPEALDYTPRTRKPVPAHDEVPRDYPTGADLWAWVKPRLQDVPDIHFDARLALAQLDVADFYRHHGTPTLVLRAPSFWACMKVEEGYFPHLRTLLTRALDKRGVAVDVAFKHEAPWRTTDACLEKLARLREQHHEGKARVRAQYHGTQAEHAS